MNGGCPIIHADDAIAFALAVILMLVTRDESRPEEVIQWSQYSDGPELKSAFCRSLSSRRQSYS